MRVFSIALVAAVLMTGGTAAAQDATDAEAESPAVPPVTAPLELIDEELQNEALEASEEDEAPVSEPVLAPPPQSGGAMDTLFGEAQFAYASGEYATALLRAETAAAGGHAEAATLAGIIHAEARVPQASDRAALAWFRRAADTEEPVALYWMGRLAQAGRAGLTPGTAGGYYRRAAVGGHLPSMLAYALSLKATDVPQNAPEALDWAERAAELGDVEAMYQRALMGSEWQHGPRDLADARRWFVRAAEAGHAEAALQAGLMAATGEGGEEDAETALRWVRQSAEAGYPPAQGQYGLMLYQGWNGAEPDLVNAAYWFREGAEGGDAESQFLYAYALARGEGVTQNLEAAYGWAWMARTDFDGAPVENETRDMLIQRLETVLPSDVTARLRREAVEAAGG
ncbi:tetratricopeptide repeat protein [Hyphobacterium marinum]|uniref:Tetratricopeptide repeat protein n=1 Tax=Hyphobacterium marinum TaxID=3116574 RepID=A0ABU7LYC2_9PROT|nr:tetratricopeptide repeat protein [Hyphobacterium sp. Y6023]MEE2566562.1 tetratricopeptide repeat protein [Hyphobacterium sp. Y6023]